MPYGFGSVSLDEELRAPTRHGFKGAPPVNNTKVVVKGSTGCLVLSVTFFAFVMALIALWVLPAPVIVSPSQY